MFGMYAAIELSRESPEARKLREENEFKKHNIYFDGDYLNWDLAKANASGYDSPQILEKAVNAMRLVRDGKAKYERDTVVFDKIQIAYPLMAWLLYAAERLAGQLRIMDFGGALGSSYYQNRDFLNHIVGLRWGIVEQGHFVKVGQAEFQTEVLQYFETAAECVQAIQPNFVLLSSVLQYIERPYDLLDSLLQKGIPYILIDKTMAQSMGRERLVVQHVPEWIYNASYPVWFLDTEKLENRFAHYGYEILDTFNSYPGSTFGTEEFQASYVGWFLRKKN